jgi:2,4-dienoyl-CoA reductase-like NADH-dependent reductase (Old Yellow Enzyme family)
MSSLFERAEIDGPISKNHLVRSATWEGSATAEVMERILEESVADYFSMSRPFIRELHLVRRWQGGDLTKARCISCNLCFRASLKDTGLTCAHERKLAARDRSPSTGQPHPGD